MRIIKLALLSFTILFLLVTGISLFVPSHVRISKAINVKANNDTIMAQLADATQWKNWYPGMDSAKPFYVEGKIKGAVLNEQTHSYIVITQQTKDEVQAELVTSKIRPVINVWKTIHYTVSDSTTVQWYMEFNLRWYPWEKFASLLFENSYGQQMEQGLTNLKAKLEK
jgi:hypothetical protein